MATVMLDSRPVISGSNSDERTAEMHYWCPLTRVEELWNASLVSSHQLALGTIWYPYEGKPTVLLRRFFNSGLL